MKMRNIRYKSETQSGPCSNNQMDQFKRQMRVDVNDFEFDQQYVRFVRSQNGGEPVERHFQVENGDWFSIDRFLNFTDMSSEMSTDQLFNVHYNWNLIEDRLLPGMFPFAALPGGNYLLFHHSSGPRRQIVLWYHEKSTEQNPFLCFVATDFEDLISKLRASPH